MKSTQLISMSIASILILAPMMASAEDAGATGAADVTVSASATVETTIPTEKRQHGSVIITKELDKSTPLLEHEVKSPRDVATGQASGRMMASGTKPLPPKMEDRMETRDRVMASGSPIKGERVELMKERMQERRGEILKRRAMHMITIMRAATERFTKIADRLDSRITKMKEKGIDTSAAEAKIVIARAKIEGAKAALTVAEGEVASAVVNADATTTAGTAIDAGKSVREALQKARTALEEAHKALVEAIVSLRANVKIETHASTSAAVAN